MLLQFTELRIIPPATTCMMIGGSVLHTVCRTQYDRPSWRQLRFS